eukprot:2297196-Pyramimonas_sp.AAC.1
MVSYNAVPWASPFVAGTSVAGTKDNAFPLDGAASVTFQGVGFARSPFARCAVVPPDPARYHRTAAGNGGGPDFETYCNPENEACGEEAYGYDPEAYPPVGQFGQFLAKSADDYGYRLSDQ